MLDIWMSGIARAGGIEVRLQRVQRQDHLSQVAIPGRRRDRLTAAGLWLRGRAAELSRLLQPGTPAHHA